MLWVPAIYYYNTSIIRVSLSVLARRISVQQYNIIITGTRAEKFTEPTSQPYTPICIYIILYR